MAVPWRIPVVQAPLGSAATPALVAAVSAAGGLGTLAGSWTPPAELRERVRAVARATPRAFAVNLVAAFDQRERLAALLDEDVAVITFSFGLPTALLRSAREAGRYTMVQVGSTAEAVEAAAAGADAVILQGVEAGGHVQGRTGLLALLRETRAELDVPLVAAGGIADVEGARAARAAGADAVTMGTRFLATPESAAHPVYVAQLLAARAADTVLVDDVFDVGWREAPHRVLRNATIAGWEAAGRPPSGQRPGEGEPVARRAGRDLVRYGDDPPIVGDEGDVAALALYCGQGVGLIDRVEPAAAIVARIGAAFMDPPSADARDRTSQCFL